MAPLISLLCKENLMEARAVHQTRAFDAALLFARTEGIISAPETSHAIRATIDEALKCKETGKAKTIVFNHSGHGIVDLGSYERYLAGELKDLTMSEQELKDGLASVPKI
jgi:tryptophan synthase beta chain